MIRILSIILSLLMFPLSLLYNQPQKQKQLALSTNKYSIEEKYLSSASMDIDVPNINLNNINDHHVLTTQQIDILKNYGVNAEQASKMTLTDFRNFEKTMKLSEQAIACAKYLYPDLKEIDITKWTYGQLIEYYTQVDAKLFLPTAEQSEKLLSRGITLDDARYLLGVYQDYETLLKQDDATIKLYITEYYWSKVSYAQGYGNIESINQIKLPGDDSRIDDNGIINLSTKKSQFSILQLTQPPYPDYMTTSRRQYYTWVENFPYYKYISDWFHNDSGTPLYGYDYILSQAARAGGLFRYVFNNINLTPKFTNLYGTWSTSQHGAHEGLDMSTNTENWNVYAAGSSGDISSYSSTFLQTDISTPYSQFDTALYGHMQSRAASGSYTSSPNRKKIGEAASVGGSSDGVHLHIGIDTTPGWENEDDLSTNSPYEYAIYAVPSNWQF